MLLTFQGYFFGGQFVADTPIQIPKGNISKNIYIYIAVTEKLKLPEKSFGIEDDDLLIAAYCFKYNLTLVTNNTKQRRFKNGKLERMKNPAVSSRVNHATVRIEVLS
ncbi:hypothetical protein ACYULU_07995 [Breznakiellaceae bacterium SP9]